MTTTLSYIILYVGTYSRLLSVGAALWNWPFLRGGVRLFALLEMIGLGFTVYSTLTFSDGNNAYLNFLSVAVDALFMSLMYGPLMPTVGLRRAVWLFGPLFAVATGADYWWGEGRQQLGANYISALECGLVSIIILLYLNHLLRQDRVSLRREPIAIISVCLLVISLIALPIYLFSPALMSYSMTLTLRAYDLMFLSAFFAHTGYAYAFWFTRSQAVAA
ncbi:hypothetical protein FAES_3455 [Fibrella aestuarina BUZ 2]|uniref:Uncharacterized protein n=1 Tax=Fibrella aestuarina BUZ 2 TaxID=1166018 RepID=I0KBF9_9BACT|nr:hypothetical protein [Fibrella aestuarina]CCH01462.1 hypothetical protein FAES_3455 [Fibrella aestuarina BUZ 2]